MLARTHGVLTVAALQLVYENHQLQCQLVGTKKQATEKQAANKPKRRKRTKCVVPPELAKLDKKPPKEVKVTVSHTLTLRELKLLLFNKLQNVHEVDVHPMNMDCYVKGRLLAEDDNSLQGLLVRRKPHRSNVYSIYAISSAQKIVPTNLLLGLHSNVVLYTAT